MYFYYGEKKIEKNKKFNSNLSKEELKEISNKSIIIDKIIKLTINRIIFNSFFIIYPIPLVNLFH